MTTQENLRQGREAAEQYLLEVAQRIQKNHDWQADELDIVLCGSYARQEVTGQSDFDFLILAYRQVHDVGRVFDFRAAAEMARKAIGAKEAGTTGTFGRLVGTSELIDRIGLEEDTNVNTTRRLLLLEESVPLFSNLQHKNLISTMVGRYLMDAHANGGPRVPRFLLNDVERYWRTIAVDYAGKLWRDRTMHSGVRYIKLRSYRKLMFFSTLIAVLYSKLCNEILTIELLVEQFQLPPAARIAQLLEFASPGSDIADTIKQILLLADHLLGKLADENFRQQLNNSEHPDSDTGVTQQMRDANDITEKLHDQIILLLTWPDPLVAGAPSPREVSDRYLLL